MKKIPCQEYATMILPSTAEKTGGICMPCKNGTRKAIEASKKYYAEQRKYDPYRELWIYLVKRTHTENGAFDECGFERLTPDEKLYYAVSLLEGEVYNGGMYQFFANSSGGLFDEIVSGLKTVGADTALELLRRAAHILFGDLAPPHDWHKRYAALPPYPEDDTGPIPQWCTDLEAVDRAFWKDPDQLGILLSKFADTKGLLSPFING